MLELLIENPLKIDLVNKSISAENVNAALAVERESYVLHLLACRSLGFMDLGIPLDAEFDPELVGKFNIKPHEYDRLISELELARGFTAEILTKSVEGYPRTGRSFSYFLRPSDFIPLGN